MERIWKTPNITYLYGKSVFLARMHHLFSHLRLTIFYCIVIYASVLCVFVDQVQAQEQKPWSGFAIETNFMAGKVLKHTAKFRAPVPDLSSAFEINFMQQTFGKKAWHARRYYPVVGFGFTYTNYGIDSIYGKCISMYPNLQIPIIRGKNLEWTFRMGFGLGYVTKRFERSPAWDTLNTAVGSHFNNFSIISTDLRYHISKHIDVQLGLNFTHISNAALRQPNLGVNMYGGHIGVRYFPVTSMPAKEQTNPSSLKSRWLAQARLGLAFNEAGQADGPLYPVYLLSAYASKRWRSKNKLFIGIDYSYHRGIEAFLKNNEISVGEEKQHSWKSAVFVGNEFLFGRVGIILQVGYYLKDAALRLDPFYQKLGGNLYIIQNETGILKELYLSILLKTHRTQAELAELGLGIGI